MVDVFFFVYFGFKKERLLLKISKNGKGKKKFKINDTCILFPFSPKMEEQDL